MHKLAKNLIAVACVAGSVGIAAKFALFWDNWVYFPLFPNICDSAWLVFSVSYLGLLQYGDTLISKFKHLVQ
jgi:hypothetical protein